MSEYNEPLKCKLERQRKGLKADYDQQIPLWRDLADNFLPFRGRNLADAGKPNQGKRRNLKIINETPIIAARTFAAGLLSGATSQSRPWFRLETADPAVMEDPGVSQWLYTVETRMRDVFGNSNFYNSLRPCYSEYGVFGTLALGMFEDSLEILHTCPYTIGGYYVANDEKGRVNVFAQEFKWTVRQIIGKFVKDPSNKLDAGWERISVTVRQAWENRQRDNWVDLVYSVQPNEKQDSIRADYRGMPFSAVYYERDNNNEEQTLGEQGYREFPIMCARLSTNEGDAYGTGLAVDCLGSAKALQLQERRKAQVIDKEVDPPLTANPSLRNTPVSQLPGDVTFVEMSQSSPGVRPVHEWRPDRSGMLEDIASIENRINKVMFSDIFTLFINDQSGDDTATEAAIKNQERLQMMGPVVEGVNYELLGRGIERAFNIMLRQGLVPEPPQALDSQQLKIKYVSILAQAQNVAAVQGINQFTQYVIGVAGQQSAMGQPPTAMDVLDVDQAVQEYGNLSGVVPTIMRSDDQIADIREARAQAQAQQQQAQALSEGIPAAADAAKKMSETKMGTGSALDAVMEG